VGSLLRARLDVHVLVADDGSRTEEARRMEDSVRETAKAFGLAEGALRYARHSPNRGKGAVLRESFLAEGASGGFDVLGFLDADGSTPFAEALRLIDLLRRHGDEADAYLGCRLKCLGIPLERKVSRHLVGRVFATMVSNLYGIPVYDSQCGAKFFKASLLTPGLLRLCDDDRWIFDTQLLIALWRSGARLRECPVAWREVPGSKVSLVRDPARMLLGLVRFRRRLEHWQRQERS
jgi:glycosyltransferase involved in cell wall biosynthesis